MSDSAYNRSNCMTRLQRLLNPETEPRQSASSYLQPVSPAERYTSLDVLRGLALLGVLVVNLLSDFRISLPEHILYSNTSLRPVDRAVETLVAALLEFKAFTLFSLLFGVGLAVVAQRAAQHAVPVTPFLVRRLSLLLGLGLFHLLLIWNGDILTLYAVCGLLLIPFLRLPSSWLGTMGILVVAVSFLIPWGFLWPTDKTFHFLVTEAGRVYSTGRFTDILAFHYRETALLILPLLGLSLPKTWGLMALGAATWKYGLWREPERHSRLLWTMAMTGGVVGGSFTALQAYANATGQALLGSISSLLVDAGSYVPLALAYAAALLLILRSPQVVRAAAPFAAVGQMALTNYLIQSVVLSLLFYGYGLGLYGRLGAAPATAIGLGLYGLQMGASVWWLRRYRFGPVEWLWRSLTYGKCQKMQR